MSGVATLRVSTATAPAAAGTQVIPVLSGMPTLSGFNPSTGPSASLMTLDALATFFGGGGVTWPLAAPNGSLAAPSYGFTSAGADAAAGIYWDPIFECVTVTAGDTGGSAGLNVAGALQVGFDGDFGDLYVYPDDTLGQIGIGATNPMQVKIATSAGQVGFYGVDTIARQLLATGAGNDADDIIAFLQLIGLCKQS